MTHPSAQPRPAPTIALRRPCALWCETYLSGLPEDTWGSSVLPRDGVGICVGNDHVLTQTGMCGPSEQ